MELDLAVTSYDLNSEFTLGALYTMEQEGIPVLTELMNNSQIFSSMICIKQTSRNSNKIYKWPTLSEPSHLEPTWRELCSVLHFMEREDLVELIKTNNLKGTYLSLIHI